MAGKGCRDNRFRSLRRAPGTSDRGSLRSCRRHHRGKTLVLKVERPQGSSSVTGHVGHHVGANISEP